MTSQQLAILMSRAAKGVTVVGGNAGVKVVKKSKDVKPAPRGITHIKSVLDKQGIPYVTELKFADNRRFRFDVAIPFYKVGIEYEGLCSKKSRHTTISGYSKDTEKYNLAMSLGWKPYRYTALTYERFEEDLKGIIAA